MTIYSGKLDVLAETIVNLLGSHEISEANVIVNQILDGIDTNTLSISSLKLNSINWKGKEDLYDLGIIYHEKYKFKLQ